MTTQISLDNIQQATLNTIGSGPRITSVVVTDSSYNNLDDTAVDTAGGFIKILGAGFKTGCTVTVNRQQATSVTFVSATEIRAQLPSEVAGTYVVYVVNTDGSVALRVNGVTFSALPAWTTGSTLPNGDSGTAVSIQLAAAQATQYTLAQGSTLPPGLTLSSSGLLSGTVTVASETLYNFQIVATDAQLQDSPRTFSITISVGDPLFAQTTLLLPGSVNTFVRDASTNNFPITVFGDTRPSTLNPYLTGWSTFFSSGDFITVSDSEAFTYGNSDFTIEYWVNPSQISAVAFIYGQTDSSATTSSRTVYDAIMADGKLNTQVFGQNTTLANITSTTTLVVGRWYHVAVVRNGATLTQYINGVQEATANLGTSTVHNSTASFSIGRLGEYNLNTYNGFVSNFRIVKGTAVYTSNFTPPTGPLTAIANTSFLTCQSNRFVDNSSNNLSLSPLFSTRISSSSPFVEPATTNGSGYFDGTGDVLTVPSNAALAFGTGDFTLEMWYYTTVTPTSTNVCLYNTGSSNFFIQLRSSAFGIGVVGSAENNAFTATFVANQWYHIAVSRSGSTVRGFVNGSLVGSGSNSVNYGQSGATIGGLTSSSQLITGYISNLRVIRGTALYTAAFTPPTSPLTAVANTSLLTLQTNQPHNNSQFLDSSSENQLITRNGNATQGSFSPYSPSGWSNYFDGTGDFLTAPTNAAFGYDTSNFTIEFWLYLNSTGLQTVFSNLSSGSSTNPHIYINTTIRYYTSGADRITGASLNTGQWYHIALCRSSGSTRLFINGTQSGSTYTDSNNYGTSAPLGIGTYWDSGTPVTANTLNGYISNVRVVKGSALYTTTFTPSTQPLTAVPGTVLLTCADNRLIDDSVNNFAVTRNGDVRATNFAPFRAQTQVPNTYSAFFDGTGDYLTAPVNEAFNFGTGDFTIECWFNTSSLASVRNFINNYNGAGTAGWGLQWRSDTTRYNFFFGDTSILTFSSTPALNIWTHVAVSRSGTTLRMFVDGVLVANTTNSTNLTSTRDLVVGDLFVNGQGYAFPYSGYISNVRVVKGTALYTANFTPPTSPLTAVPNTSLLTCQSPTFVDNSTNRFAITAFGNSQPSMVNPFGFTFTPSTGYSAAAHGGSLYFSATSAYVLAAMNGNDSFGTRDFTVDLWFYPLNSAINISFPNANTNTWGILTFNNQLYWQENGGNLGGVGYGTVVQGSWNHIAVCRSGSTIRFFINGVQVGSLSNSFNYSGAPTNRSIGPRDGGGVPAYISNFRIVRGTALYTSNFAPPIAPVQPVAGTVLLVNGSNAAVTDATTKNVLETVGDTAVSTLISRTGGSSMRFDNNGDYLIIPYTPLFAQTRPYTVEFWFYPNYNFSGQYIFARNAGGYFGLNYNGSTTRMIVDRHGVGTQITGANNMPLNQWHHFAMTYDGTTTRTFANGVLDGSVVGTGGEANDVTTIGFYTAVGSSSFGGYISDFRFTTGTARYTTNFTPPAGAFQTR